jgi:hypothetical protein
MLSRKNAAAKTVGCANQAVSFLVESFNLAEKKTHIPVPKASMFWYDVA